MVGDRPNSSALRSPGRVRNGASRPLAVVVVVSLVFGGSAPMASAKDRPNRPPMVKLRAPSSAAAGATITLDGSSTNDTDGTIASWDYSFGDGTHQPGAGRVIAVEHVFS